MSNRVRISKLYSSFEICWGAFLKRWLQSSRIFSYFYLIDDCAYRVARELGASAKQETWQETWVRLARLARPPHPSRLPSRSLFFFFSRALKNREAVNRLLSREVWWRKSPDKIPWYRPTHSFFLDLVLSFPFLQPQWLFLWGVGQTNKLWSQAQIKSKLSKQNQSKFLTWRYIFLSSSTDESVCSVSCTKRTTKHLRWANGSRSVSRMIHKQFHLTIFIYWQAVRRRE